MLKIDVLRSTVLGIDVVRGFAALSDLARISRADVFDEKLNPLGTQRDLSPKHAREAYAYARNTERGYWPEVFLCLRDAEFATYVARTKHSGTLEIDDEKIVASESIVISRVDGNHRLYLADGRVEGTPAIDRTVSFCLAMSLNLHEEISIFRDINNNQRKMDTSHLDKIELRLRSEEDVRTTNPALYIANRLAGDEDSPIRGFVYLGGRRPPGTFIPLRALTTGVEYMMSRQNGLTALGSFDAQLRLIKNYFCALKNWIPGAWEQPKDYLLLRGAGLWGSCFLGAEVIDRVLASKKFDIESMEIVLRSGRNWNWSRSGDFQGLSGRGGAVKISSRIIKELKDESGISMNDLLTSILRS